MQDASGFLASDGRFFFDAEECRQYESELERVAGIQDRCKALINAFQGGVCGGLPAEMQGHLSDPEGWMEETWNEVILPMLFSSSYDSNISIAGVPEFNTFEKKLRFARLVICYALNGSSPSCSSGV